MDEGRKFPLQCGGASPQMNRQLGQIPPLVWACQSGLQHTPAYLRKESVKYEGIQLRDSIHFAFSKAPCYSRIYALCVFPRLRILRMLSASAALLLITGLLVLRKAVIRVFTHFAYFHVTHFAYVVGQCRVAANNGITRFA